MTSRRAIAGSTRSGGGRQAGLGVRRPSLVDRLARGVLVYYSANTLGCVVIDGSRPRNFDAHAEARANRQDLRRRHPCSRRNRPRGRAWDGRPARAQWCRQDDPAVDSQPGAGTEQRSADLRRARRSTGEPGGDPSPARLSAAGIRPDHRPDWLRVPRAVRPASPGAHAPSRSAPTHPRAARGGRAAGRGPPPSRSLLRRHDSPSRLGPGDPPLAQAAGGRRAHRRPRSRRADSLPQLGDRPGRRDSGPAFDPYRRGHRGDVSTARDHRPRPGCSSTARPAS